MGKSKKKNPFAKYVWGKSDKWDKQVTNRIFRKINRRILKELISGGNIKGFLRKPLEARDRWSWRSDGTKCWVGDSKLKTSLYPEDREIWRRWMAK